MMNDFNRRWRAGVDLARRAAAPPADPPEGFASRVLARRLSPESASLADAWFRLGLRALAGAFAVLAVMAMLEWHDTSRPTLRFPHVEHAVGQVFWIL